MTDTKLQPFEGRLYANDFEVEKDDAILHVMISEYRPDMAHVIERGPGGQGPDRGGFAPYDRMPTADAMRQLETDGWQLRTTQQMVVTNREPGWNNTTISGVCSPDVTEADVKKRFYHSYFGGRQAWVRDGRFGCVIHTD